MKNGKMLDFSAVLIPEGKSYSAWCPELDVASQGDSEKEALSNLKEAVQLHLECITPEEIAAVQKRKVAKFTNLEVPAPS